MTPRQLLEDAGVIWTRRERRRLARADAAPGRRSSKRWGRARSYPGFARFAVRCAVIIAVPGLRTRDVEVLSPAPGTLRVELSGPHASPGNVARVRAAIEPHVPHSIALDVATVGGS